MQSLTSHDLMTMKTNDNQPKSIQEVLPKSHTTPESEGDAAAIQSFIDSMASLCHCSSGGPCDGVLAGGLCDNMQDEPTYGFVDEDEQ